MSSNVAVWGRLAVKQNLITIIVNEYCKHMDITIRKCCHCLLFFCESNYTDHTNFYFFSFDFASRVVHYHSGKIPLHDMRNLIQVINH